MSAEKYNTSHKLDLVAKEVLDRDNVRRRAERVVRTVKEILSLSGFYIDGKLDLIHYKSGRRYHVGNRKNPH